MASAVVCGFEPIYVDVSRYELSTVALGAIDLASDGSQPGAAPAYSCQLVSPGIFTVPCGLGAIFRCNLAIVAALRPVVRCHLAVIDCSHAAVRGIGAIRGRPDTCVRRALTVARRPISCGSVEITRRVVTRFGVTVAQLGRDVTIPRSQTGLATSHCRLLVGPGIFAVLGSLRAIFSCDSAVVDGSHAAVGSLSAARVSPCTFVIRALAVARRAIARRPVAITGRVVPSFGLSIT